MNRIQVARKGKELAPSGYRKWIGLLIGVFYAVTFYGFLFLSREALRLFAITRDYDIPILNSEEQQFYNIWLALLAGILAQSQVICYWKDYPNKVFAPRDYRRKVILNDSNVLTWYFMHWMAKIVVVISSFFYMPFSSDHYALGFYPQFKYLFILLLLVLFLQPWLSIRRIYKDRALKYMGLAFLFISLNALAISRIKWIDVDGINNMFLDKNIVYKHNIELPEIEQFENYYLKSFDEVLYVFSDTLEDKLNTRIVLNESYVRKKDLLEEIHNLQDKKRESDRSKTSFKLFIDKEICMGELHQIHKLLKQAEIRKVHYAVLPVDKAFDNRYYRITTWRAYLPLFYPDENLEWFTIGLNKITSIIEVSLYENGLSINNKSVGYADFKDELKKWIRPGERYLVRLCIADNSSFNSYAQAKAAMRLTFEELRLNYLNDNYSRGMSFDAYENELVKEAINSFPKSIFELHEEYFELFDVKQN